MSVIITIPTCKQDISEQVNSICHSSKLESFDIYSTKKPVSAAENRNDCIAHAIKRGFSYIIMIDDDISGFYPGWTYDMLSPLQNKSVIMSSARLINAQRNYAPQMGAYNPTDEQNTAEYFNAIDFKGRNVVCSAAIAWRVEELSGMWFDTKYKGSGFEDTDYCFQINHQFPDMKIVVTNECKLIHKNEAKHQGGTIGFENRAYFLRKWGLEN